MSIKFLLHVCCAPCSIAIIDELHKKFDLSVFFYNPNIHPEEEYLKRKNEVIKVCQEWGVPMFDCDHIELEKPFDSKNIVYDEKKWHEVVKGLEKEPEMGARCPVCFRMRLEKTADYAAKNNFDIFGTSLTTGRNKKSDVIHPIGLAVAKKYNLKFYEEDWKKGGRQEKGRKMISDRNIYRQDYCGCVYSK